LHRVASVTINLGESFPEKGSFLLAFLLFLRVSTPDLPAYDISFLLQSIGCKDGRSYSAPSLPFKWRQTVHGRPLQGTAPPMCAYKIKNLESAQQKNT
jgi:hypothetical protein